MTAVRFGHEGLAGAPGSVNSSGGPSRPYPKGKVGILRELIGVLKIEMEGPAEIHREWESVTERSDGE